VNVRACVRACFGNALDEAPRDEFRAILTPVFTGQYLRELERGGDARSGEEGLFGAK